MLRLKPYSNYLRDLVHSHDLLGDEDMIFERVNKAVDESLEYLAMERAIL